MGKVSRSKDQAAEWWADGYESIPVHIIPKVRVGVHGTVKKDDAGFILALKNGVQIRLSSKTMDEAIPEAESHRIPLIMWDIFTGSKSYGEFIQKVREIERRNAKTGE